MNKTASETQKGRVLRADVLSPFCLFVLAYHPWFIDVYLVCIDVRLSETMVYWYVVFVMA